MRRLLPQTLFGQTLAVLLAGIGLSLALGAWIYSSARQEAVRAVGALAAVERIVNLSRLVAEVPPEWRARIVDGANDAAFRIALAAQAPTFSQNGETEAATAIVSLLREALPGRDVLASVIAAGEAETGFGPGHRSGWGWGGPYGGRHNGIGRDNPGGGMHEHMRRGPAARAAFSWRNLHAAVRIGEREWLTFATGLPETGASISPRLLFALGAAATLIVLVTIWAVRRVTSPLDVLSAAAERLGKNVDAQPLTISGTAEMRRAAEAFNDMQARLRRLIENRTLMLAAISHDLRTQLTLLRLRAENQDASEDRERMLKTIGDMEDMLASTLSFARDEARREESKRADIGSLVASIVDDMADAGRPVVASEIAPDAILEIKPVAMRRALTNLVDNAVKYGIRAKVSLTARPDSFLIAVEDEGPGIPEDSLKQVLQPFTRLEDSRSRETGGMGLGLAIAASVIEGHGGELKLENRREGGLRALVVLPRAGI
jgi:signal transduction histidine kinase